MGGPLRTFHNIPTSFNVFVETGTNMGETTVLAAGYFKQVYTIELAEALYRTTKAKLSHFKNIEFLRGDSAVLLGDVSSWVTEPAVFFLDAHWSGGETAFGSEEVPLYRELNHIAKRRQSDLIIIDDFRLFGKL